MKKNEYSRWVRRNRKLGRGEGGSHYRIRGNRRGFRVRKEYRSDKEYQEEREEKERGGE